jgi:hypothetical protein
LNFWDIARGPLKFCFTLGASTVAGKAKVPLWAGDQCDLNLPVQPSGNRHYTLGFLVDAPHAGI